MSSPGLYARTKLVNPVNSVSKDQDALRIGILGAANIAPNALIGPAKYSRSIIVVSVAARDENKAKEFAKTHGIPSTHSTYVQLISDPTIDCIYNALPNGLHYEWTRKALEANKHVLLEKPAASNASQTQELVTLAKSKNLILLEAFHYRFHPASIQFREIVRKEIRECGGKVKSVEAFMSFPQIFPNDDIRFKYSLGGGTLMDCGCYTVNAIRYFTGLKVEDVEEARPKIMEDPDIDGRMDATLRLASEEENVRGIPGKLVASLTNSKWSLQTWREYFPRVIVETEDKVLSFYIFVYPSLYHYISIKTISTGKSETLKFYDQGYSTYKYQLDTFVKAVLHVRDHPGVERNSSQDEQVLSLPGWVSGEDSVENMSVIDAIYKRAGMKLRI
ncbi:hypothetical protein FBU30_005297 [Linnemannia zychae]|nr:hypothetical protein FBU30_005297 [Linnemannia zychae]